MKDFLTSAEEQLKFNKEKHLVLTELGDHFETKKEFFKSIGYDNEASAEKANEAMGNGEVVGQRLNQIHRNKTEITLSSISITALNIAAIFASFPTEKSTFFLPFILSLIVLIDNLFGTVLAIKRKTIGLSAMLIGISLTLMWISMAELAYPLCNLIISRVHFTENFYTDYYFFRFLITAVLIAAIVAPNAYNIYHCKQMRRLKNTKKQNIIAGNLRSFCVIAAVFCIIAAFPYYAMNDRLCEEQAEVRDELINFVFETQSKFDSDETEELRAYLENSEYDFEDLTRYKEDLTDVYDTAYICNKGNWQVIFIFYADPTSLGYSAHVGSIMENSSEKYLFTRYEKENALIETLGDDGSLNSELYEIAKELSVEEIKDIIADSVHITTFSVEKYEVYSVYNYYWLTVDYLTASTKNEYANGYVFLYDEHNVFTDYIHIPRTQGNDFDIQGTDEGIEDGEVFALG